MVGGPRSARGCGTALIGERVTWRAQIRARRGAFCLDLDIRGGVGPLALVGPNGSGKTTFLHAIVGACRGMEGEIEVQGRSLFSSARGLDLPSELRRVGYVPQGSGLFPHLRVVDNVAFGLSTGARCRSRSERREVASKMLDELGCGHLTERLPRQLSGGERQRVALARVMVTGPDMLLLDEPLAALDATSKRRVRDFLARRLRAMARPSIIYTHDFRDVQVLGAPVCVVEHGSVVQRGSLEELRRAPASDFVREFVGIDSSDSEAAGMERDGPA